MYAIIVVTAAIGIVLLAIGDIILGALCLVGTIFSAIGTYRLRRPVSPS